MNSFKNPLIPLMDNPVNIDRAIQDVQIALSGLTWLEKAFGRSWLAYKSTQGMFSARQATYPHVWQGAGKDLLEVMPNDNIKSQVFFKVEDPITFVEFIPNGDSMMRAIVSIIFWFNLKRIDDTIDYPFTELLKGQALRVLSGMTFQRDASINVLRTWEKASDVFRGYDITELKDQELVYPWGGFRFETELTYREDCPATIYDVPPTP